MTLYDAKQFKELISEIESIKDIVIRDNILTRLDFFMEYITHDWKGDNEKERSD